ncbi:hypothetical protein NQ314_003991 [Rhamnusium bicolor]|uniref:Uncharacterized protein n=1 Tax=Rhamnusium bicolor TaxID=1586634 RepID=A0AAV8ZNG8_9CUCU|nr:hypothetical protein NQ314_003991 [Rhamnusium bicolor]
MVENWASRVRELRDICDSVKSRLDKAYNQSAARYNLRRRTPLPLEVGQVVWKRNHTLSDAGNYFASKLAPKFLKCKVAGKVTPNVYKLTDFQSGKYLGHWHIQDLKLD